ncbi:ras-specific guanine nucleotide-releasing factor RalGPS2-like isoform X3 [Branchiostoma floridae]|uniref:Ras-specific guanine nucleotide-releasing factor RalGPS2-like isoform X3 n=1 Tax=Branchiostoma floridae TaxID=7739 RepID=A0A9J7LNH5_BRAFL|nr:ras-specific guanine nucleotide-releasing factor RalGPS2-like isoform X3 [Branchiostoma floridae]
MDCQLPHLPLHYDDSPDSPPDRLANGYHSDDPDHGRSSPERYLKVSDVHSSHSADSLSQRDSGTRWTLPRLKSYDAVVFDALKVSPEEFASQISLLDLPVFKAISPEELLSCAWNTKEKVRHCPNVVNMTRRFNHVSFWVVREILTAQTLKIRGETLSHFIKIAKKLFELNNIHSTMSVVSGLRSAPIFRLTKTWALLSRRDKAVFERLAEVLTEDENRQRLRDYMEDIRLPCIPYLGMYLTDLTYINAAHPHSGGLESEQRRTQMNNICRIISEYQQSSYDHLPVLGHVQNYLRSVHYIEELEKFVEDDNYKLSLKIEPGNSRLQRVARDDLSVNGKAALTQKASSPCTPTSAPRFVPTHRKSRSLGTKRKQERRKLTPDHWLPWQPSLVRTGSGDVSFLCHTVQAEANSPPPPTGANGSRHLLDDSVLEESPGASMEGSVNGISLGSSEGSEVSDEQEVFNPDSPYCESPESDSPRDVAASQFPIQGFLRRKTILKNGSKPRVAPWTRYWVALWGTSLIYYAAKSLRGQDRHHFKSTPGKIVSVVGWMVIRGDNPVQPDVFLLTDSDKGNTYKFQAGSQLNAHLWSQHLGEATKGGQKQGPTNLMSFE